MHPPLLPNPSGDGLQFYEKKKPLWHHEDEGNPTAEIGMVVGCCVISYFSIDLILFMKENSTLLVQKI